MYYAYMHGPQFMVHFGPQGKGASWGSAANWSQAIPVGLRAQTCRFMSLFRILCWVQDPITIRLSTGSYNHKVGFRII